MNQRPGWATARPFRLIIRLVTRESRVDGFAVSSVAVGTMGRREDAAENGTEAACDKLWRRGDVSATRR